MLGAEISRAPVTDTSPTNSKACFCPHGALDNGRTRTVSLQQILLLVQCNSKAPQGRQCGGALRRRGWTHLNSAHGEEVSVPLLKCLCVPLVSGFGMESLPFPCSSSTTCEGDAGMSSLRRERVQQVRCSWILLCLEHTQPPGSFVKTVSGFWSNWFQGASVSRPAPKCFQHDLRSCWASFSPCFQDECPLV